MRAMKRLPALLLCLLCGCATLFRGNTQEVRIDSYPPGAAGDVDGMSIQTPAKLMLKRNESHTIILRKQGYREFRVQVKRQFAWAPFLPDLLFWKVLGSKDLSAGAWRLVPDHVYANLELEEASIEELLERARILLIQSPGSGGEENEGKEKGPPILLPAVFRIAETAKVFAAPDICRKAIGTLYEGTSVVVLEEEGNWYRQSCPQFPDGWILKSVVRPP